jgi:hypothetical protein
MQNVRVSKKWIGLAALGCALCCALPFAAILGIGGTAAVGAFLARVDFETAICVALLGGIAGAAMYATWRRSRARKAESCEIACRADGGCCAPQQSVEVSAKCDLPVGERDRRGVEFQSLFALAFLRRERRDNEVTWLLEDLPGVFEESIRLSKLESSCCPFLKFDVATIDGKVRWRIGGPSSAKPILDLLYELPVRILDADGPEYFGNAMKTLWKSP